MGIVFKARIKLDPKPLAGTLAAMLSQTRRDKNTVCGDVGKTLLRRIVALTPPGNAKTNGERGTALPRDAQKRGQEKVKADILKLMEGVAVRRAERSASEIPAIHAAARKAGVVKGKARSPKITVPLRALNAYIKRKVAQVGRLAAGWKKAAHKLGINLPGWVEKHNAPGDGSIKITPDRVRIKLTNAVRYASDVAALYRRVRSAMAGQQKAMEDRMKKKAEQAAERAGLKKSG